MFLSKDVQVKSKCFSIKNEIINWLSQLGDYARAYS